MFRREQMEYLLNTANGIGPICIPTYKRWSREDNKALSFLELYQPDIRDNIHIFVRPEQAQAYHESFPWVHIVVLPAQIQGLASTREYICCDDFRGEYFVGNINSMSIIEIWMHPRFESARKFLYAGLRVFHPCDVCATSPIRPGLLPDRMGKETMPEPSQYDYDVVSYRTEPLAGIVKREWEDEHHN